MTQTTATPSVDAAVASSAPVADPPNPRGLGVTCCTSCGQPVETVGELRPDGCCGVCGSGYDRGTALIDELKRAVASWVAACHARSVTAREMEEAWELTGYEVLPNPADFPTA